MARSRVLDGMEQALEAVGRRGDKVHFVRYADDFIVTGANRQLLEQKVTPAQTVFLQPRGLELSEQKTVITHIQAGFNFLGHTVRKYFSATGETGGFSVQIQRRGKSGVLQLYRLASTRIERHIKVQGQAQPYDPQYTKYFEQRRCFAWRVR